MDASEFEGLLVVLIGTVICFLLLVFLMSEWLQEIKEIYTVFKNKTKNMEKGYKTIPFDITRINDKGARVVTKKGYPVRILCTDKKGGAYPIAAIICYPDGEILDSFTINGRILDDETTDRDLVIQIPEDKRRMTNKELAWWLRDCPEEHRECRYGNSGKDFVESHHSYPTRSENQECGSAVYIRSNGGEWHEPLIDDNVVKAVAEN